MLFTLGILVPLALVCSVVRVTRYTTTKVLGIGGKFESSSDKYLKRVSMKAFKCLFKFIVWVVTTITSSTIFTICVVVLLLISSVVGVMNIVVDDDKTSIAVNRSGNSYAYRTEQFKDIERSNLVGDLSRLEQVVLDMPITSSKHIEYINTSVSRKNFSDLAYMLVGSGSSTTNARGNQVCKYIGYIYGDYHGSTHKMKSDTYIKLIQGKPSESTLRSNSQSVKELKAGLLVNDGYTIFMDCSGFVQWFWATLFCYYDRNNANIKELANWFCYCSSGSSFTDTYKCERVPFSELKEGDILVRRSSRGGHVAIYIGDGKYIHSSCSELGVYISSVTDGNFATSSGFHVNNPKYGNAYAYRPRINFSGEW